MTQKQLDRLDNLTSRLLAIRFEEACVVNTINKIIDECDHKNPDSTSAFDEEDICKICGFDLLLDD